jgi:uncharacterized protein
VINMLRFPLPAVIVVASILSVAPHAPSAGQAESPLRSESPVNSSHLWDSSDFVHVVGTKRSGGKEDEFAVTLRIEDGFHINANPASLPYLIPTSLTLKGITPLRIAYPVASRFKPNFVNELLDVYQGTIVITAFLAKATLGQVSALGASVTVQACTDAICLPPAELLVQE